MSYLERLKKLDTPTIAGVISIKRPSDTFDTTDKRHISVKKEALDTLGTTYQSRIPEIQFLADLEIKRNQSRCSVCVNLYACPSARNINGQCPTNYKFTQTQRGNQ